MKICTNVNNYDNLEIDVDNRMATYDDMHQPFIPLAVEKNISSKSLVKKLLSSCNAIANHISMGSSQYMEVCQMTVYFGLDKSGNLYTLWATNFICSNIRSSTRSMFRIKKYTKKTEGRSIQGGKATIKWIQIRRTGPKHFWSFGVRTQRKPGMISI